MQVLEISLKLIRCFQDEYVTFIFNMMLSRRLPFSFICFIQTQSVCIHWKQTYSENYMYLLTLDLLQISQEARILGSSGKKTKCSTSIQVCQGTNEVKNILLHVYSTLKYIVHKKFRKLTDRCLIKRSLHSWEVRNLYLIQTKQTCK